MIAIDIDPIKIDYARHNAALYGVIKGDCFSLAPKLKVRTFIVLLFLKIDVCLWCLLFK